MSLWLNSLKTIFARKQTRQPLRKTPKRIEWSCRPTLETLEERLTPSGTPFSGTGYDGAWTGSALTVNTAQADGTLANHTLSIGTVVDSGNTFVTINGTEISGVLTNEVTSLALTNTDQVGVKFDLSAVSSTNFSHSGFAVTVTGLASDGDTLAANDTTATWSITAVDGGTVVAGYTTTFTNISNIVGGSGNNTFEFAAGDDVDGSINGGGGSNSFDFSNQGSGGYASMMPVSVLVSAIDAGTVTAHDTFTFANIGSITGGSGANTFTFDDTSAPPTPSLDSVTGYGSTNTLNFGSVNGGGVTVDVTTPNAGTVGAGANVSSFSDIQTIDGSAAGSDLYQIEPAAYTGSLVIDGGVPTSNSLSYPDPTTGNGPLFVNLQSHTATGISSFSNIEDAAIAPTDNTYTLTGANSANDWEISGANAGNINGGDFTFSGFNVLNAGTGGDTFDVDSTVSFGGAIHGNTGADTLNLLSAGQTVSGLSDSSSGFSGSVGTVTGGFTNIDVLTGTGTTNTLTGENAVATWNLDGSASQYNANSHTLTFDASFHTLNGGSSGDTFTLVSSFTGSLNGGSGANTFAFDDTSVLTGSIVGNTGTDTLDYSSYTPSITVALSADAAAGFTGTATGISAGFSKIDAIIGTGSSSDSLTGENATSAWNLPDSILNPLNTYVTNSHTLIFSDIANLNGGTFADTFTISGDFQGNLNGGLGNDHFVFTGAGSVTGNVIGGSTTPGDTLDYSGYGSGVSYVVTSASTTTGATGTVTGIGGGFSGITNLVGATSYTDSLTVAYSSTNYTSATWAVSGGASGTNTFTDNASKTFNFSKIENLIGTGGDTFNVTASHTGDLTSAAGTNAFNVTSSSSVTVALTGNIYGGTGVDTVTINGNSSGHPASVTGNIVTGGGGDFVHLTGHASVGGQVNAGDPTSPDGTLSYNGFTTSAVTVNIATGAATAIDGGLPGGIAYFTVFTGANNASDKLTGPNSANNWSITANNAGNINSVDSFSQFKNLIGGTSTDDFVFAVGTTVTSINGGAGANIADFSAYAAGITASVAGANAGTINTNAVTFTAIGSLVGSSNGANTWQFKVAGSLSGSISSGSSGDSLTYNPSGGYTKPVTVNLQTGTATLIGGTFTNVVSVTGSSSTANTLIGTNTGTGDTFTVTGSNAGSDNTVSFTKFQNLTGTGSGNTYAFTTGSISGKVNGGTGSNTLDLSGASGVEAVNLATGKASLTGGFLNINTLVGNDNAGTSLTGSNVISTWALTGSDAGTINSSMTFSGFAKLVGGSLADDFVFSDTVTIQTSINGGAGSNTMDLSAYTTSLDVAIMSNNGGNVSGSVAPVPAFSNIQNITGGSGGNDFDMYAGHGVTGALNGGSGRNSLDYTRYTTGVSVNLTTHAATNVGGGATNFLDVYGSATAKNSLTGDGGNDVLIGGTAVDTISASNSVGSTAGTAILIGGGGKDTLNADNGWDILIAGSTSLSDAQLDTIAGVLASVNSGASLAAAKATIENGTAFLSSSVTSSPGSTINNGATNGGGNDWDILNVITTLKKLKTAGDIRTFE